MGDTPKRKMPDGTSKLSAWIRQKIAKLCLNMHMIDTEWKGEMPQFSEFTASMSSTFSRYTITELRKKLSATEGDILALRQAVAQRDAAIAERDAEIAERVKMAEVLSRDRNKQADELPQKLASKIRIEYRDFVDALDVPMSCDLGENLRLQIQSIFDILEKGGMKIK